MMAGDQLYPVPVSCAMGWEGSRAAAWEQGGPVLSGNGARCWAAGTSPVWGRARVPCPCPHCCLLQLRLRADAGSRGAGGAASHRAHALDAGAPSADAARGGAGAVLAVPDGRGRQPGGGRAELGRRAGPGGRGVPARRARPGLGRAVGRLRRGAGRAPGPQESPPGGALLPAERHPPPGQPRLPLPWHQPWRLVQRHPGRGLLGTRLLGPGAWGPGGFVHGERAQVGAAGSPAQPGQGQLSTSLSLGPSSCSCRVTCGSIPGLCSQWMQNPTETGCWSCCVG